MTIKAVAFDIGGVLIDWNPRFLYQRLIPDDAVLDAFMARIFNWDNILKVDGFPTLQEGMADLAQTYPADAEMIDAYLPHWGDTIGPVHEDVLAILRELHSRKIPCYALSNWAAETWSIGQVALPFLDLFDGLFISGLEGVAKPDIDYFNAAAARFALSPAETLFIDDQPKNVAGAEAAGFVAIQFVDGASLRRHIVEAGLLDVVT
jgi:2-haloacid dehalogenase